MRSAFSIELVLVLCLGNVVDNLCSPCVMDPFISRSSVLLHACVDVSCSLQTVWVAQICQGSDCA